MTSPSDRGSGSQSLFNNKQLGEADTLIEIAGDIKSQMEEYHNETNARKKAAWERASLITKNTFQDSLTPFLESLKVADESQSGPFSKTWKALDRATYNLRGICKSPSPKEGIPPSHMNDDALEVVKDIERNVELLRFYYHPNKPQIKVEESPLQDTGPFAAVPTPVFQETASESSDGKSTDATAWTSREEAENDNTSPGHKTDADSDRGTKNSIVSSTAPVAAT